MRMLCFGASAYGWYEEYIPLYQYSLARAYPTEFSLIGLAGEMSQHLERSLEPVNELGFEYEIFPAEFSGYRVTPRSPAMWRFLLLTSYRQHFFYGFNYIYITDLDMIICPEAPSLVGQHVAHCLATQLPYSGHVRRYTPELMAGRIFLGHEFLRTVGPIVDNYDHLVYSAGEDIFDEEPRHPDERMLYKIVVESGFGTPPQLKSEDRRLEFLLMDPMNYSNRLFSPHHGIHLGIFRKDVDKLLALYRELFEEDFYRTYFKWVLGLERESGFQFILKNMSGKAAETVHKMLKVAHSF